MKKMGLKPLGDNGTYLQAIPLVATEFTDETRVTLDGKPLVYGTDWSAATLLTDMNVEAKMIFVGHGVVSDELGRNDLKDADLKGKIAVIIQGPPRGYTVQKWTEVSDKIAPIPQLITRGAAGVILVTNERAALKGDFIVNQMGRRNVATAAVAAQRLPLPLLFLGDEAGKRIFDGSSMDFAKAMDAASDEGFQPMDLKPSIKVDLRTKQTQATSPNVVGYIEGSDPVLKNVELLMKPSRPPGFSSLIPRSKK